jgi:hypothetical protein
METIWLPHSRTECQRGSSGGRNEIKEAWEDEVKEARGSGVVVPATKIELCMAQGHSSLLSSPYLLTIHYHPTHFILYDTISESEEMSLRSLRINYLLL